MEGTEEVVDGTSFAGTDEVGVWSLIGVEVALFSSLTEVEALEIGVSLLMDEVLKMGVYFSAVLGVGPFLPHTEVLETE